MSNLSPVIVWFRKDLRLEDHPALSAAAETGQPLLPLFIYSENRNNDWPMGEPAKWWLHHSLEKLNQALNKLDSQLILLKGDPKQLLVSLCRQTRCTAVFYNQQFTPQTRADDRQVMQALEHHGIVVHHYFDYLLLNPDQTSTQQGTPYKIFTPFWKKNSIHYHPPKPLSKPKLLARPAQWPASLSLAELNLLKKNTFNHLHDFWTPGHQGAKQRLQQFIKKGLTNYSHDRDFPAIEGISRLSPHLHFGEITPCQIWHTLKTHSLLSTSDQVENQTQAFIRQLFWRDFAAHLLYHFPHTLTEPLNKKFVIFPWMSNQNYIKAWQLGRTGYPLVDAGMRELAQTGFMHNRVRMIAASFLTKDLLIPWQTGAKWFWKKLVDADLANNTFGWQWTAGCGADASPFFRIFNPTTQSQVFDSQAHYIKKWVPELKLLPLPWIFKPWQAPQPVLKEAGVLLGKHYPYPIVDHDVMRKIALGNYEKL